MSLPGLSSPLSSRRLAGLCMGLSIGLCASLVTAPSAQAGFNGGYLLETETKRFIRAMKTELAAAGSHGQRLTASAHIASQLVPSFRSGAKQTGMKQTGVKQTGATMVTAIEKSDKAKPGQARDVTLVPLELALSQVAMQVGSNHFDEIKAAQASGNGQVLTLRKGHFTMAHLFAMTRTDELRKAVTRRPDGYGLHLPVLIMPAAHLSIAGEQIALSSSSGAFIINLGTLGIEKAAIAGMAEKSDQARGDGAFKPFLMTALGGRFAARDSQFSHLGFGDRPKFRGLSFISGHLFPKQSFVFLSNNRFDHVGTVELKGMRDFTLSNNSFNASGESALRIEDSMSGQIIGNLVMKSQKHGLRVTNNSTRITIRNNIIFGSKEAAIFVGGGATATNIVDNILLDNKKSGIISKSAACPTIHGNAILRNGVRGILSENTFQLSLKSNVIALNKGPGISLLGGAVQTDHIIVEGNRFERNALGLGTSDISNITLKNNDFSKQLPALFSGEMTFYLADYLKRAGTLVKGNLSPFIISKPSHVADNGVSNSGLLLSKFQYCNDG